MDRVSLRIKIDEIDAQLVELFVKRMDVAGAIGKVKFEQGIPIYDKDREEAKIESLRALVDEQYKDYVEQLYRQIFELSRTYQKECTGVGNGIA
ncbi:MAG: chorismate mutase, partial [Lachnospiraceae bacterium]|nr:chorismate mutase [Lachnospiraceae bacterium]